MIEVRPARWRDLVYVDGLPIVEAADSTAYRAEQGDTAAQQQILNAFTRMTVQADDGYLVLRPGDQFALTAKGRKALR